MWRLSLSISRYSASSLPTIHNRERGGMDTEGARTGLETSHRDEERATKGQEQKRPPCLRGAVFVPFDRQRHRPNAQHQHCVGRGNFPSCTHDRTGGSRSLVVLSRYRDEFQAACLIMQLSTAINTGRSERVSYRSILCDIFAPSCSDRGRRSPPDDDPS